jgi:pimeloyl-ACP methyl ester carboxylesterase
VDKVTDQRLILPDGRIVGFVDYGDESLLPVIQCHGSPGSRRQPHSQAEMARENGFRVIGVDRPGFGLSSPRPGRSIADCADDTVAVADHLGIKRFMIVGASTGGAYALAVAALVPDRVLGVLLCCAMTDMRWAQKHAPVAGAEGVWNAPDRATAIANAIAHWGRDGSRANQLADLPPADIAFITNPTLARFLPDGEAFRQGVTGVVDDRVADSPTFGWSSFNLAAVKCPVTIIHGLLDSLIPVAHAGHISSALPTAEIRIFEQDGHLSINDRIIESLMDLRSRVLVGGEV